MPELNNNLAESILSSVDDDVDSKDFKMSTIFDRELKFLLFEDLGLISFDPLNYL